MLQAIEQSVDQRLFLEQLVPIGEFEIRRDNCRHAIVARIHQAEEGVDLFRLERQIPQLVNQQDLHRAQSFEQSRGGPVGQRSVELVEQSLSAVEAAAIAIEASFAQQSDGKSGFSGSGRPDQQNIVGAA